MRNEKYSLLMQKVVKEQQSYSFDKAEENHEYAYDLLEDFNIVVLDIQHLFPTEVKEDPTNDWADEDGLDVYNSQVARFKDFDATIKLGTKGTCVECNKNMQKLLEYFTTNGVLFNLYSDKLQLGRTDVRFKSVSDIESHEYDTEDNLGDVVKEQILEFSITLNIANPTAIVKAVKDNNKFKLNIM